MGVIREEMLSNKVILFCLAGFVAVSSGVAHAELASKGYVDSRVPSAVDNIVQAISSESTQGQLPSARAAYEFSSNASNLSSGTVPAARLPVASSSTQGIVQIGTGAANAAAGNDQRFDTVSTSEPTGTADSGRVFIWFE